VSAYTYDLPATAQQREAIGMVASEWSYLESIVDTAIWNLAGIPDEETGRAITTHVTLHTRFFMLETLFRLRHGDTHADTLHADIEVIRNSVMPQRNEIVHGLWVAGPRGSPMLHTVKARGRIRQSKAGKSDAEIRDIAALIKNHSTKLQNYLQGYGAL
jgi:hypothetical protein